MFKAIDLSARAGSEIRADRAGLINGVLKEIDCSSSAAHWFSANCS